MKRTAKKILACALSVVLVFGMMPAQALGVGEGTVPEVSAAAPGEVLDSDSSATGTDVYIDVMDDFRIVDRTQPFTAQSVHDALEQSDHRIFAQVAGGSGVATATWTVRNSQSGQMLGTFSVAPDSQGVCALPLSGSDEPGALHLSAPGLYTCDFTATDRSKVEVSTSVAFEIAAPEESEEYQVKTVYEQHEQTFDGVKTHAEPSATGLFHEFVTQLGATRAEAGSETYDNLLRIAAEYAVAQDFDGAYAMLTAWQLAAELSIPREGDPVPFAGALSVVMPVPADDEDGVQPGDVVTVFRYGTDGAAATPLLCTVQADSAGQMYVQFEVAQLGAFGIAKYRSAEDVTVIATAQGSGFINYEGRYVWHRDQTVRYTFTPVEGHRLASVRVEAGGAQLSMPEYTTTLGYYDLDLSTLDRSIDRVNLKAVFEEIPEVPIPPDPGPDPPVPPEPGDTYQLTTEVTEGSGQVYVNGQLSQGGPFEFTSTETIWLVFQPEVPSLRVKSAEVLFAGAAAPAALNVLGTSAVLRGLPADAHVTISFDSEQPPEPIYHTVSMTVAGGADGHGSIDTAYEAGPTLEAQREVRAGGMVSFTLHPQEGYCVYTVLEGDVELGSYLADSASGLTFTMPDVQRDHAITVTFSRVTQPDPPVGDQYVSIQAEGTVDAGTQRAKPPIVTPPLVVVPKGAGYTFCVIPANNQGVLSKAQVKAAGSPVWTDITQQVEAAWTLWPEEYQGVQGTGYYALMLEDVQQDTFVRVSFRDATDKDDPRPPTPTRNVSILVEGTGGTVSPNTMDGVPLQVPVDMPVQVTVVRANGHHLSKIVFDDDEAELDQGSAAKPAVQAEGTAATANKDVLEGKGSYTIPDRARDQAYTFVFAEDEGGSGDNGDNGDKPVPPKPGPDEGNGNGDGNGDGDSDEDGGQTGQKITVTPVVVLGSDGTAHGAISPGQPVQVAKGDSLTFALKPDAGYRVARVEANGDVLTERDVANVRLTNIQQDTELRVSFVQRTQADGLTPVNRALHTLKSLAATGNMLPKTGDGMMVMALSLVGIACVSGIVLLIAVRRRNRSSEDSAR